MKQSDLLPCPFDGVFPDSVQLSDEGVVESEIRYCVKCQYCGAEGPYSTTKDGACNSWNHRWKNGR